MNPRRIREQGSWAASRVNISKACKREHRQGGQWPGITYLEGAALCDRLEGYTLPATIKIIDEFRVDGNQMLHLLVASQTKQTEIVNEPIVHIA